MLPVHQPRYHSTSPHIPLPGKVEQAVATQRAQQWIKRERTRYFANPTAPLIPESSSSQEQAEKPERDAVVQTVQEARYEEFGFMIVRLEYSDENKWTRYSESFDGPVERSVAESAGGKIIVDKLLIALVEDEQFDGTGWHGAVSYYRDPQLNSMVQDTFVLLSRQS